VQVAGVIDDGDQHPLRGRDRIPVAPFRRFRLFFRVRIANHGRYHRRRMEFVASAVSIMYTGRANLYSYVDFRHQAG
jgi:hypothetical protein